MTNLLFKTGSLVIGLLCFGMFSCKKKTNNSAAEPAPLFSFEAINIKLGGTDATAGNGRYDGSGALKINASPEKDARSSVFADKNKNNYDIELPTNVFGSATKGCGDLIFLKLNVEDGVTAIKVKKVETEVTPGTSSSTNGTEDCGKDVTKGSYFSFGVGKLGTNNEITDLPKSALTKVDNKDTTGTNGDVIVLQSNISYKKIGELLEDTKNNVVFTVTATKGSRTTTKTLTIKGHNHTH